MDDTQNVTLDSVLEQELDREPLIQAEDIDAESAALEKANVLLQRLSIDELDAVLDAEDEENAWLFNSVMEQHPDELGAILNNGDYTVQPTEYGLNLELGSSGQPPYGDTDLGYAATAAGATEIEDFLIGALLHPLMRQQLSSTTFTIPGEDIFFNSSADLLIYKELQSIERSNTSGNLRLSPSAVAARLQKHQSANYEYLNIPEVMQNASGVFSRTLKNANEEAYTLINSPTYTLQALQYVEHMFHDYLTAARKAAARHNLEKTMRTKLEELAKVSPDKWDRYVEGTQEALWPLLNNGGINNSRAEQSVNEIATAMDVLNSISNRISLHQESVLEHFAETGEFKTCAGYSTGFDQLDDVLNGFVGGDVVVLAARPSIGKTDLAIAFTDSVLRQDKAVSFVTLEMPKEQLGVRFLAKYSGLTGKAITNGLFDTPEEMDALNAAAEHFGNQKLTILDSTDDSGIFGILRSVAKLVLDGECDFLVIDYLQLLDGAVEGMKNSNRESLIAAYSREIKRFAKKHNIPVLLLSQLNRDVDKRGSTNKRPQLTDLRESGSIEQDANVVIMMYREDRATKDANQDPASAVITNALEPAVPVELLIRKNRNGPLDTVILDFEGRYSRWTARL